MVVVTRGGMVDVVNDYDHDHDHDHDHERLA
jgi:hypothetical protein